MLVITYMVQSVMTRMEMIQEYKSQSMMKLTQIRHMKVMPMFKPPVMKVVAMSELWTVAKM